MSTLKAYSEDSLYIIGGFVGLLTNFLTIIPAILMIIILCFLIWYTTRKVSLVIFTLIGLLFILNINYWAQTMQTLALVLTSVIISIIVGIPIGILASQNERFSKFLKPTLDFVQTMPAFVYLIPAITFFGVGVVPGIIASVIFAMPPTIRFTDLGIRTSSRRFNRSSECVWLLPHHKNYLKYNYHSQLERSWLV